MKRARQRKELSVTRTPDEMMSTARHEAAHAVVGYILGMRFRSRGVTIVPKGNDSGSVAFRKRRKSSSLEDTLKMTLAGAVYLTNIQPSGLIIEEPSAASRVMASTTIFLESIGDAAAAASILQELWQSSDDSPIGRATEGLMSWATFLDPQAASRAATRFFGQFMHAVSLIREDATAAEQFVNSSDAGAAKELRQAEAELTSNPAEAQRLATSLAQCSALVAPNPQDDDPRVFPFLHRMAQEAAIITAEHQETIEALTNELLRYKSLSGERLTAFLADSIGERRP